MPTNKTKCTFCDGDGCCNCDYTGKVSFGEACIFKTIEAANNHNPEISLFDYQIMTGERDLYTGRLIESARLTPSQK